MKLGFHQCTEKDREYFYEKADEGEYKEIERDFLFLYCLDDPSLVDLKANDGNTSYSSLSIILSRCKGEEHCKTTEETEFFIGTHLIRLMFNQQTYMSTKYGDEEIIQNRIVSQKIYLDTATSSEISNHIQKQTLQSEESLYNFLSTGVEKQWYTILTEVERQIFASGYNRISLLRFETSKHERNFQRSVYSILDYLGDVGGLLDGLRLIAVSLIVPFSSYNYITLLLKQLFSVQRRTNLSKSNSQSAPPAHSPADQAIHQACNRANQQIKDRRPFKEMLCKDFLTKIFACFVKAERKKRIYYGVNQIKSQLDIVRFIRNQVAFERYLKVNVSPLQRHYLRNDPLLVLSKQKLEEQDQQMDHQAQISQEIAMAREESLEQMRLRQLQAQAEAATLMCNTGVDSQWINYSAVAKRERIRVQLAAQGTISQALQ